mmetsp:Transcript_17941/g.33131  ORF Transcript_17941/g.33131 Transcript_17941/m.33131 type:complete len:105 (+) Transcript_17941:1204-1518(+)
MGSSSQAHGFLLFLSRFERFVGHGKIFQMYMFFPLRRSFKSMITTFSLKIARALLFKIVKLNKDEKELKKKIKIKLEAFLLSSSLLCVKANFRVHRTPKTPYIW